MRKGSLLAAIVAVATFFLVTQVASAQYPSPKTNLVCAINQIDVTSGSSTAVAATLRDSSGAGLAGYTVSFSVVSGDASLTSTNATTDSSGTAVVTVNFGSSGTVVIQASSESSECQASTQVNGIVPPATGSAGLLETANGAAPTVLAFGLLLFAAAAVAIRKPVKV